MIGARSSQTSGVRVVAIHPSAEMYGSDRMFLETVSALGDDVSVVLPGEGPLAEALRDRGITYEVLAFPILRRVELRSPGAALRHAWRFLRAIPALAGWLRSHGAAVLYVSTVIAPAWIFAGRLAGRRVVCHVHESEPTMSRSASRLLLWPLRATHGVIANSVDTRNWVVRSGGAVLAGRTSVVYNGIPRPAEGHSPRAAPHGGRELVLVGRLSARKGQDVAIRATALLRERGHDVQLTLVGDCFPGYEHVVEELHALVERQGMGRCVSFAGFRADPTPYVRSADVVLVPSRIEPFGLVAVEALMLGRPVVASDVGGLPEIISDGVTGRLVPPDDPGAVADAVAGLLDDPALADGMGRAGRDDAMRRFSTEAYRDRMRAVLNRYA